MTIAEVLQISAGMSPAFVAWVAMELRWLRHEVQRNERRTDELERLFFKKERAYG